MAEAELLARLEQLAKDINNTREVMDPQEAAEFLRLSYAQFRKLAPALPRHRLTANKYVYLRSELLQWIKDRRDANAMPTELHTLSHERTETE